MFSRSEEFQTKPSPSLSLSLSVRSVSVKIWRRKAVRWRKMIKMLIEKTDQSPAGLVLNWKVGAVLRWGDWRVWVELRWGEVRWGEVQLALHRPRLAGWSELARWLVGWWWPHQTADSGQLADLCWPGLGQCWGLTLAGRGQQREYFKYYKYYLANSNTIIIQHNLSVYSINSFYSYIFILYY